MLSLKLDRMTAARIPQYATIWLIDLPVKNKDLWGATSTGRGGIFGLLDSFEI